jgi:hypothetical protein
MSNSGNWNSGNWNSGNRNSGNRNSSYSNSGDSNSGDSNSGDSNSGNWNSGNCNSGDWNSGYRNSGFFNNDEPTVRMFGQDTGLMRADIEFPDFFCFGVCVWVYSADMTDAEKTEHPSHVTTGGFLRTYKYKDAWRKAWDGAEESDRKKVLDLPKFDADIFLDITGIDVRKEFEGKVDVTVEGNTVQISRESARALGLIK